jgi:hypothetical protein
VLAVVGGVAAALAATVTVGVLSYDAPSRDTALPDDLRAGVPDASAHGDASPSASDSEPPPSPAPAAPSGPPSVSRSPSPSASSSKASPTPSATPTKQSPSASAGASSGAGADNGSQRLTPPPVLRLGDDGPEVTELQLRLKEAGFYFGDIDESYDRQVEAAVGQFQLARLLTDDESGVYGLTTRSQLESETDEP